MLKVRLVLLAILAVFAYYILYVQEGTVEKYDRLRLELHQNINQQYVPLLQDFAEKRAKFSSKFEDTYNTVAVIQYTGSFPKDPSKYAIPVDKYNEDLLALGFNIVNYDQNPDLLVILYESSRQTKVYEGDIKGYEKDIEFHWLMQNMKKPKFAGKVEGPALDNSHSYRSRPGSSPPSIIYGKSPSKEKVVNKFEAIFGI